MMWYYGSGMSPWMWVVGATMMVLLWGGVAALVVWAVTALAGRRGGEASADEILRRRLAAGQISRDEYERTRTLLQG